MSKQDLEALSDADLVKEFAKVANRLGEAVINWDLGVKETKELFVIRDVLKSRGENAISKLTPLLKDRNRFVQYYAARQLYALFPELSRQIVEENSKKGDAIAGDAGMHLLALGRKIQALR